MEDFLGHVWNEHRFGTLMVAGILLAAGVVMVSGVLARRNAHTGMAEDRGEWDLAVVDTRWDGNCPECGGEYWHGEPVPGSPARDMQCAEPTCGLWIKAFNFGTGAAWHRRLNMNGK